MKKNPIKNLDLDLFYEKLDNGLQILVIPKDTGNNIYATFSTNYGSNKIEFVPIGEKKMVKVPLGIAHFLEHKLFEQPNGVDPFSFYSERGSDANANTNQTKTTYLFSGPSFLEENLNYLLDYVQEPYFTDKNVDKEKGIITQEIKMYQDDPDNVLYESIIYNTFQNDPMKYPIIGTIKSINSITKENLYTCYNTFYHPSNMFVVVTGNVKPEEVIEIIKQNQAKKKFAKPQKIKLKAYDEPEEVANKEQTVELNVSIPKCAVGYKIKINNPDNLYQTLLYISILFDMKLGATSKFVKDLTDEEIINTNLILDYVHTQDYILFFVVGESKQPSILLEKIQKEMNKLKLEEREFNRKRKTLISSLIYMSDNIFQLNESIMSDMIRYGKYNTNKYEDIKNLNFNDFEKFVKSLNLKNITTFIVNPKTEK